MPSTTRQIEFLHAMAKAAAKETLAYFRLALEVENKDKNGFDPVTVADRKTEQAIIDIIKANFPNHKLLSEEFNGDGALKEGSLSWVIDPIDGTRAYISGMPTWATLIGLYDGLTPVMGLMDQPFIGERFWAVDGNAYWRSSNIDKPIKTRSCPNIAQATLATTAHHFFEAPEVAPIWHAISSAAKLTRYGGDSYNYVLLAAGHIDVVIERDLHPYDILPLRPIIEGAGGIVTDWQGNPVTAGGHVIACGDKTLHAQILNMINAA